MNNSLEYDPRYGMPTIDDQQQTEERREYEDAWRLEDAEEQKAQALAAANGRPDPNDEHLPF